MSNRLINEYDPNLENERITVGGKILSFLGTYGDSYHNDMIKRTHIETKFPNCKYIVIWPEDFKNGVYEIDRLFKIKK